MILLKVIAAEEAQDLNRNAFERVCWRVAFICVENRGTYIVVKDVWMVKPGLYRDLRGD